MEYTKAEKFQARFQDEQGAGAEADATGADGGVVNRDFVGGVEGAERAGQFVEIEAEEVGAEGGDGLGLGIGELDDLSGEGEFRGGIERGGPELGGAVAGGESEPAENGVHACAGVEEIGGGVALEGDHFFPGEGVVAGAVLAEIRVLDRADADHCGDGGALFGGQLAGFLVNEAAGAFDGFVEEIA